MVVENLRHHLSGYDPTEALYLGCRFKREDPQGFMSAGAGNKDLVLYSVNGCTKAVLFSPII